MIFSATISLLGCKDSNLHFYRYVKWLPKFCIFGIALFVFWNGWAY